VEWWLRVAKRNVTCVTVEAGFADNRGLEQQCGRVKVSVQTQHRVEPLNEWGFHKVMHKQLPVRNWMK